MSVVVMVGGKPHIRVVGECITATVPVPVVEQKTLEFAWKGLRIPATMIAQAISFCRDVNNAHHAECVGRFMYHPTEGWAIDVLPQIISGGLVAREHRGEAVDEILSAWAARGYIPAGSWHSHCNITAFQSGTDTRDETKQSGLHVTFGKLDSSEIDIHARYVFKELQYEVKLGEFVDATSMGIPEGMRDYPGQADLINWMLHRLPDTEYSAEWEGRMGVAETAIREYFPSAKPVYRYPQSAYSGYNGGYSSSTGFGYGASTYTPRAATQADRDLRKTLDAYADEIVKQLAKLARKIDYDPESVCDEFGWAVEAAARRAASGWEKESTEAANRQAAEQAADDAAAEAAIEASAAAEEAASGAADIAGEGEDGGPVTTATMLAAAQAADDEDAHGYSGAGECG